jgi:hypothetical protein
LKKSLFILSMAVIAGALAFGLASYWHAVSVEEVDATIRVSINGVLHRLSTENITEVYAQYGLEPPPLSWKATARLHTIYPLRIYHVLSYPMLGLGTVLFFASRKK